MKSKNLVSRAVTLGAFSIATLCATSLSAATFSDDFNRTDTAWTQDGSIIGTDWVIGNGTNWRIVNNELESEPYTAGKQVIWNTAVSFAPGDTTLNFSGTLTSHNGGWNGIVFNLQDDGNYYTVRLNGGGNSNDFQFLVFGDGGLKTQIDPESGSKTASAYFNQSVPYTVTVTLVSQNLYGVSISGSNIDDIYREYDVSSYASYLYSSGYTGFYSSSVGTLYDDYSMTTNAPESSTTALLMGLLVLSSILGTRPPETARLNGQACEIR